MLAIADTAAVGRAPVWNRDQDFTLIVGAYIFVLIRDGENLSEFRVSVISSIPGGWTHTSKLARVIK
jgi:hypothetical protein